MEPSDIQARKQADERERIERIELLIQDLRDQIHVLEQRLESHSNNELLHGIHGDAW